MFQENSIETCILSRVKQITGPGWMHETSARTWCSGRTWRERVGKEVGGGIGMGKTCEPKAFSFQCMTKFTTNKKKIKSTYWGFPDASAGKESICNAGGTWDLGLILRKMPWGENGNPLQHSYLENPMDRGAKQATVRGVLRVVHNWMTKHMHAHSTNSLPTLSH